MSGPGFDPNSVRASMAQAEHQPTQFPAAERSLMIRDMILKVETLQAQGKSVTQIRDEVKDFAINYPRLFEMVTRPGYDKAQIRTMLVMLNSMGSGKLSQHQASMIIGQKVYDAYVAPLLRNDTAPK